MARQQRQYTEEFRREAVRLMEMSRKPVAQIVRDRGVNDSVLYRWRDVYGQRAQPENLTTYTRPINERAKKSMNLIDERWKHVS
jgi:transposase-like protein